jgi:RNA polymerase sigma-70 factor (ECF subfamily)
LAERTDAELVGLTRSSDREAYGALVARYQGHVYGLAYSLAGNWADAQDIAQETFVRAYVNLDQLREPARFAAWLRRVTFSVAMNWLKAFRPRLFQHLDGRVDLETLEIPDFRPGPPEVVERRELAEAVQRAIATLPPKYRVPLTMFHLDGLSYQKVADFLDIPLGTVKVLIHRARAKLKDVLPAYLAEEVVPVVQEVFNEHKLPAEFAQKVLENVPSLSWDRLCTFAGALEAALAATEHPYSYSDIMGLSGLAFRARWWSKDESPHWCPSSAVGEMEEEMAAVEKATGWPLHVEFVNADDSEHMERLTTRFVGSINSGRPVLAYEPDLDMDVVYGYEESGEVLVLRDRAREQEPLKLTPPQLGFMTVFLGEHTAPPRRRDAFVESLRIAIRNWKRERFAEGPGEYWYGDAALARWISDLGRVDEFSDEERGHLAGVNGFCYVSMIDAREAGVKYLKEHAAELEGRARAALERAAEIYKQEVDLLRTGFDSKGDLEPPREIEVLSQSRELEAGAIAELEKALQHIEPK